MSNLNNNGIRLTFYLNNDEFHLPFSRRNLNKIPEDKEIPYNSLATQHEYTIQSKIKNDTFQSFLNYWNDDELPQITLENIWEYYQLSEEFGILREYLSTDQFSPLFNLSYLINLNNVSNFEKICFEKKVAINLDHYLTNYASNMKQIQIDSLCRIFNHQERNLIDHDLAYQFIIDSAVNDGKDEFYTLLQYIDSEKMDSHENRRDSLINTKLHFGFSAQNSEKLFIEIENKMQNLEQEHLHNVEIINELESRLQNANQINQNMNAEKSELLEKVNNSDTKFKAADQSIQQLKLILKSFKDRACNAKREEQLVEQFYQNLNEDDFFDYSQGFKKCPYDSLSLINNIINDLANLNNI